jgi:thiamine biosynthesis lipoprotein
MNLQFWITRFLSGRTSGYKKNTDEHGPKPDISNKKPVFSVRPAVKFLNLGNSAFGLLILFFCWAFAALSGCARALPPQSEFVLGTICTVNLYDGGSSRVYREIFGRLREIENRMSANLADSELERINRMAGIEAVPVHGDLLELVEKALYYADISGGAFDPAVGPLVKLWGIGTDSPHIPSQEEIDSLLPLVNRRDIEVDRRNMTVFLRQPGMRLDLGAVAKGYAADETAAIIRNAGIKRAVIDLGGNVFAYGEKEDGSPWRIGIQNPLGNRGEYIGIMEVRNKTIVTSGVYERFIEADGKRYHHLLSPATGFPADNGLLSVTIIADSSIDADGLSTAAFVLGCEKGRPLVESMGAEAVFVFEDYSVRGTAGILAFFTLTDPAFTLEP